jgi:hypothetical protein
MAGNLTIVCPDDCGNAPKKAMLKEFNIAMVKKDLDAITAMISDQVSWNMIGDKIIQGKEAFTETLKQRETNTTTELSISTIITHGNAGSVNGSYILANGKKYAYCEVYKFTSTSKQAKIKEISSYVIEVS